jgi:pimeloyl-ACP methyl ester carboxylesterase
VVLVGGSGPADRSNGGYFDAHRDRFVAAGMTVLAYDKRGVGASSGSWASAGVAELAGDVAAAVGALRARSGVDAGRIGIFGHSEGGWVALRACANGVAAGGLVLNSCPAVSFIESEVHALSLSGVPADVSRDLFDPLRAAAHSGCDCAAARRLLADVQDPALREALDRAGFRLTDETWSQLSAWIEYAPEPDLRLLDVPALAVYGSRDPLVPVSASEQTLARFAPNVRCQIFDGADHRLCIDGSLATGYLEAVTAWYASTL